MPYLIIAITALLTLAYLMTGLRAMLQIDATFGARHLPRTNTGTWLAIAFWPIAWIRAAFLYRRRSNRRVLS